MCTGTTLVTVWKYVAVLHTLFLQTITINFPRRYAKIWECVLFTNLNGQFYLCCVIYSAAYFVVGLIPGGSPFTAASTRGLGNGLQRQNVGQQSGYRYVEP